MKKFGAVLECLLPLVLALLCQMVVSIVFSLGYGGYLGMKMAALGITELAEQKAYLAEKMSSGTTVLFLTALATAATLLIGALWYRNCKPGTDFKLKKVLNGKLLAAVACLGLSLQFLISTCLSALYPLLPQSLTEQYSELINQLTGGTIWLSLLVTVILAPLAEEFLFRGVTLKKAQNVLPFFAANVLQAFLFGVYHMNLIQGVYAFLLGMVFGFTAEYFHSIWASIGLHAFVNASAELLELFPEVWMISIAGVLLLLLAAKLYPSARKELVVEMVEEETGDGKITGK